MIFPRISIIIPVYNRAHLISETLDSIIRQSYENWECIVVDDGSTDNTLEVVKEYENKDFRIKGFKRPQSYIKGANSCRNFGFDKSRGDFIIWFDSDDLMHEDHLNFKIDAIAKNEADFIVAKTQNFKGSKMLEPYQYAIPHYGFKASDFILLKTHWYTYDVIVRREISAQISWNEHMKSWQDYNYFCKMLLITEKGAFLDEILTFRRLHENSIQKILNQNSLKFNTELLENRVLTYNDISGNIDLQTKRELIFGMMNLCFELKKMRAYSSHLSTVESIVRRKLGRRAQFSYMLALILGRYTGKGYYFMNKAKSR